MKIISNLLTLVLLILLMISCNREKSPVYESNLNDSVVINLRNTAIQNPLDSVSFLESLGNQKLQQVYDITTLQMRMENKDSTLNTQISTFFSAQDTLSVPSILAEMDSLGVNYAKIHKLKLVPKDSLESDSTGKMEYSIYYFDKDKKYLGNKDKQISYILNKKPEKLKNQFSFYFYDLVPKDTIDSGVKQ